MHDAAIIGDATHLFRQGLTELFAEVGRGELTPERFGALLSGLKAVGQRASLAAFVAAVEARDERREVLDREGRHYRFKEASTKTWLTPFGLAEVSRRYFQRDSGGQGVFPVDEACGMVDRYLTPDVEEMVAFSAALMVPREVETLLGKALPQAPSATAIGRVVQDVGRFVESHEESIETALTRDAPLSAEGDVLVVSLDGVTVPMREDGARCGRPPERPRWREDARAPTCWREASVGTVSIYASPRADGERPERVDGRVFARMPEPHMATLARQVEGLVWELTESRRFREIALICDGKPSLWADVEEVPTYVSATKILDAYHALEHLSRAAEAIFGKSTPGAQRWYERSRQRLLNEAQGVEATLRSLRRYAQRLRRGSERAEVVRRVLQHFGTHKDKMRYATFRARGLPIGSGPVEAACKTVVGNRLKRSGMRWSHDGGQNVLNLRTAVKSNRWDTLWSVYQGTPLRAAA
jgi:hypothetical protein